MRVSNMQPCLLMTSITWLSIFILSVQHNLHSSKYFLIDSLTTKLHEDSVKQLWFILDVMHHYSVATKFAPVFKPLFENMFAIFVDHKCCHITVEERGEEVALGLSWALYQKGFETKSIFYVISKRTSLWRSWKIYLWVWCNFELS